MCAFGHDLVCELGNGGHLMEGKNVLWRIRRDEFWSLSWKVLVVVRAFPDVTNRQPRKAVSQSGCVGEVPMRAGFVLIYSA